MNNSMARQRYSTSRPMRNRRRIPQRSGGLRKLILFQSLICALVFLMVIITKSIHISATDFITAQIRYVLGHDVKPKSIIAYIGKLATDVRESIVPGLTDKTGTDGLLASNQACESAQPSDTNQPQDTDRASVEATQDTPPMEANLSATEKETYEIGDDEVDLGNNPETSVLSVSSDSENVDSERTQDFINPVVGRLVTDFGQINVTAGGDVKTHMGIDIHVEQKSDVKAALDGMVAKTGSSTQYGAYVMIQHDNNLETVYAHCSDIFIKTGQIVNRGDVIAQVGDDNIPVGSHLHFEVWLNGNSVDPLEYISVDDG